MATVRYVCPSCGQKFAPMTVLTHATTVHRRTCRRCGETWQIVSHMLPSKREGLRLDMGAFTFLGRRPRKSE